MTKKMVAKVALSVLILAILVIPVGAVPASRVNADITVLPKKGGIDGTYMQEWRPMHKASRSEASTELATTSASSSPPEDMTVKVGDFGTNTEYDQNFEWVMTGEHCYIYAALDLGPDPLNYFDPTTSEYVFVNPSYPVGGWTPEDRISLTQLTFLMNEFDNLVYHTMTDTFGLPNERPSGETRLYILVMNIHDESYYDSTVTSFVIGYFSWGEDSAADKNMIHIDSYDWQSRLGPNVARPYDYESTLSHEYEHLIHNDIDNDEESWVDEGLADLASYLCGFGHPDVHIAYYLVYHPFVSLTFWGGGLENYGASYLFQLYLWEHFGGTDFTVDLVYNQLNGIEGIESTLEDNGYNMSFDEVFRRWVIANYIDNASLDGGIYGYSTLDIPSLDTWGYSIEWALYNFWQGGDFNRGASTTAGSWYGSSPQPYTAQYWDFAFTPAGKAVNFSYEGDEYSGVEAHSLDHHWYSGMGNWVWRILNQTFTIPAGGATLHFWTNFAVELDWDYLYVEVHDLTADEWTTLPGIRTTNTLPNRQDNPNVPPDREPMAYNDTGKWNALTGFSQGYYEETMDLTPFAAHTIELNFVYWTDGAYNEPGAYIDDISIPQLNFADNVEAGAGGWVTDGWTITQLTDWPNNWKAQVMDVTGVNAYKNPSLRFNMRTGKMMNFQPGQLVSVWDAAGGSLTIANKYVNSGHTFVAVFWNSAPHVLPGDYWFKAT